MKKELRQDDDVSASQYFRLQSASSACLLSFLPAIHLSIHLPPLPLSLYPVSFSHFQATWATLLFYAKRNFQVPSNDSWARGERRGRKRGSWRDALLTYAYVWLSFCRLPVSILKMFYHMLLFPTPSVPHLLRLLLLEKTNLSPDSKKLQVTKRWQHG